MYLLNWQVDFTQIGLKAQVVVIGFGRYQCGPLTGRMAKVDVEPVHLYTE